MEENIMPRDEIYASKQWTEITGRWRGFNTEFYNLINSFVIHKIPSGGNYPHGGYRVAVYSRTESTEWKPKLSESVQPNAKTMETDAYSLHNFAGFHSAVVFELSGQQINNCEEVASPELASKDYVLSAHGKATCLWSSVLAYDYPIFKGSLEDKNVAWIVGLINDTFSLTRDKKQVNSYRTCDAKVNDPKPETKCNSYIYFNYVPSWAGKQEGATGYCITYSGITSNTYWRIGPPENKKWKVINKGNSGINYGIPESNMLGKKIYCNNVPTINNELVAKGKYSINSIMVTSGPSKIPAPDGGYKCDGSPYGEADSTLAPEIADELEQYGKTFYLLGKKADGEPKLYLFDLGQVQGTLKYSHILDAVVLKQVNCKWVEDDPLKQNIKFSQLKGEVDTNFYLLNMDKLEKPPTITSITHRKANEYLLKYFPTCSVARPEGGGNPDDGLKPDFGGGGGGEIGGIGGGGFFPDVNNPLPNPEIPPCSGEDGGSQTPVSEIYLLSVPELSPTYDDTYDFPDVARQFSFFTSKKHFKVSKYSYLRKDNAIQVGSHVDNLKCYNYLMYKNKAGKWYYCFIMDKQYINERTARIIIATDVIQTYLFDYTLGACFVERCHVPRWKADGKTPTDEFEPENLEFGEPIQVSATDLPYKFKNTYIAVCSNPLGSIPSRSILKDDKPKGVDENGL